MRHFTGVSRASRRGLSLVEVTASTVLVAFLLVAALRSTANVYLTWSTAGDRSRGQELAQRLLHEALALPFIDPDDSSDAMGVNPGESSNDRSTFDDVDDFDDYTASPPTDAANQPLTEFTGWSISYDVKKINRINPEMTVADAAKDATLKRVTLTLTPPSGNVIELVGFRSLVGLLEQPTAVEQIVVSRVEQRIRVGTESSTVSTTIANHAPQGN